MVNYWNLNMQYIHLFLKALSLTIVIETLILFLMIRLFYRIPQRKISDALLIFSGVICSAATLPYLWFVFPICFNHYCPYIIFGETVIILVEAALYCYILKIDFKWAVMISMCCNAVSYFLSFLL